MRMKSKVMVGVSALGLAAGGGGAALATSQQGADTSQPSQEQDMLDHITADLDGIVNGTGPAGKPKFGFGAHLRSFGP